MSIKNSHHTYKRATVDNRDITGANASLRFSASDKRPYTVRRILNYDESCVCQASNCLRFSTKSIYDNGSQYLLTQRHIATSRVRYFSCSRRHATTRGRLNYSVFVGGGIFHRTFIVVLNKLLNIRQRRAICRMVYKPCECA